MFHDANLWIVGVTALALWLPQNAAHEGAHCLVHKWAGDEILGFQPWPGRMADGSFAFAHMSYRRTRPVPARLDGWCSSAPQVSNTLVLLLLLPLHLVSVPQVLLSLLTGWALVNFVDGAVNLGTFYRPAPKPGDSWRTTDGWRTASAWAMGPWTCRALTALWHVGMGLHVLWLT